MQIFSDNTALNTARAFVRENILKKAELDNALKINEQSNKPLINTLLEYELINETQIRDQLANNYSLDIIELESVSFTKEVKEILPASFIINHHVLPYEIREGVLKIALADPANLNILSQIRTFTDLSIEAYLATISSIQKYIQYNYDEAVKVIDLEKSEIDIKEDDILVNQSSDVITFVNNFLDKAIKQKVSDIHIEPNFKGQIRFRKDGILRVQKTLSEFLQKNYLPVIARLKIMSGANISEKRLPQDTAFTYGKKDIDFRVSFLPTYSGERTVLRILDKSSLNVSLDVLGFSKNDFGHINNALNSSQGLILVTGPTGSGKTTTLYSMLSSINKDDINILTAEDPVEYDLDGISQVQVRDNIGLTFAAALRSFLRQDPEVILVGEIRDQETANIAIKASLTGHLVLSTLHTNDAPSTVTRLSDMGVPNYLLGTAIKIIIAQRLVRKLCDCKVPLSEKLKKTIDCKAWNISPSELKKIYMPKGCNKCDQTGYKGRMSIFEILPVDQNIRQLISDNADQKVLEKAMTKLGQNTLGKSGVLAMLNGITSYSEIERVLTT